MPNLPAHCICESQPNSEGKRTVAVLTASSVHIYHQATTPQRGPLTPHAILECDLKLRLSNGAGPKLTERMAFPRIAAFSPDGTHLAISGDDKTLRIWNVMRSIEYGKEVVSKLLPKRAAVLLWESKTVVIVADRHGDLRA